MRPELKYSPWFWLFVLAYAIICFILTVDWIAFDQPLRDSNTLIVVSMVCLVIMECGIVSDGVSDGIECLMFSYSPNFANYKYFTYFNLIDPILSAVVGLLLHGRPPNEYIYWVLFCASVGALSLILMMRPVNTDLGVFNSLCALWFGLLLRDYNFSWRTWFALGSLVSLCSSG
ncbi:hypothetical protein HAX54_047991, partial [Datura stramonium]|nr:hypothetical protein [Datura stramonium]